MPNLKPRYWAFLVLAIALLFVGVQTAQSLSIFSTIQGGTGSSSPQGILYGSGSSNPLKTVTVGSGLTFSAGTLSATGGTGFSTTSADYWKTQNNFYSTTSANFWSSAGLGFSTTDRKSVV